MEEAVDKRDGMVLSVDEIEETVTMGRAAVNRSQYNSRRRTKQGTREM